MEEKYVAYVSTYTQGDNHGIRIYDIDMENGRFYEKDKVQITNSSYVCISHNRKFLYSITDLGVESYEIQRDGGLKLLNFASINGMRGCYVSTDYTDSFLFVAGYHAGKLTILKLNEDGSIGGVLDVDLLEIVRDRLKCFQSGEFATRENACALTHIEEALMWMNKRKEDRAERGVLGTYQK